MSLARAILPDEDTRRALDLDRFLRVSHDNFNAVLRGANFKLLFVRRDTFTRLLTTLALGGCMPMRGVPSVPEGGFFFGAVELVVTDLPLPWPWMFDSSKEAP